MPRETHITVYVTPGAGKEHFQETKKGVFEVYVREPPVNNMANRRVCALVAEHFKMAAQDIRIVAGHRARKKTFCIAGGSNSA